MAKLPISCFQTSTNFRLSLYVYLKKLWTILEICWIEIEFSRVFLVVIFRRPRKWGRKIMICGGFFTNSAKSPLLFTPFSKLIHIHRGTVGSASVCQARGHGFESGLRIRYIFIAENFPVLSGCLVHVGTVTV